VTSAQLAARCVELLGEVHGPVVVVASRRLRTALAGYVQIAEEGVPASAGVCSFLNERAHAHARALRLNALTTRLPAGAPIVVVDHNRPRRLLARFANALLLLARATSPARAAYPTARELHQHAFAVRCLRLAAGERIQLVAGHRANPPSGH
jgi:hypothetical protein